MSKYNYSFQGLKENMARAVARDIPISRKVGIEISNHLRGRSTERAKIILENVIALKEAIPYKRFTNGVGHRKGNMASGRYPIKAATEFLKLIKMAETNAQDKGLALDLNIIHLSTQKAAQQFHYGRQRRRLVKKAHVELVVQEKEGAKREPAKKKAEKKENVKEDKAGKKEVKKEKKAEKPAPKKAKKGGGMRRTEEEKKALEEELEEKVEEKKPEVKVEKKVEEKKPEPKKEEPEKTEKKHEVKEKKEESKVPKPAPSAEKEK
ncbi:MAG: 50S ribosomal protein L22 [archaeon]